MGAAVDAAVQPVCARLAEELCLVRVGQRREPRRPTAETLYQRRRGRAARRVDQLQRKGGVGSGWPADDTLDSAAQDKRLLTLGRVDRACERESAGKRSNALEEDEAVHLVASRRRWPRKEWLVR